MTSMADIIGPAAASARPDAVNDLARHLADQAEHAASTAQRLQGLHAAGWQGAASTAFEAQKNDSVPPRLSRLAHAYNEGSAALGRYARELDGIQQEARALAIRRDAAAQAVRAADRRMADAIREVAHAKRSAATAVEPSTVAAAGQRVAHAVTASASAVAAHAGSLREAAQAEAQAHALRQRLEHAGTEAHGRLASSSGAQAAAAGGGLAAIGGLVHGTMKRWKAVLDPVSFVEDAWQRTLKQGSHPSGTFSPKHGPISWKALKRFEQRHARAANKFWNTVEAQGKTRVNQGAKLLQRGHKIVGRGAVVLGKSAKVIRSVPVIGRAVKLLAVPEIVGDVRRGDYRGAVVDTVVAFAAPVSGADLLTGGMVGDVLKGDLQSVSDKAANGQYGPHMKYLTEHGPIKWGGDRIADGLWSLGVGH